MWRLSHLRPCQPLSYHSSDNTGHEWELFAVEINLRQSGTTHPMMLSKILTQGTHTHARQSGPPALTRVIGEYDGTTGMLHTADGDLRYYVANDNVLSPRYTALSPTSLTESYARLLSAGPPSSPVAYARVQYRIGAR
jgi:hypothetical protein